jgi:hypothetical protein
MYFFKSRPLACGVDRFGKLVVFIDLFFLCLPHKERSKENPPCAEAGRLTPSRIVLIR